MKCPDCNAWALVLETRTRQDGTIYRRYKCANLHRFSSKEAPYVSDSNQPAKKEPSKMPRLNLADAINDLAPLPPPCFLNRLEWVEYLKSCAASQNDGESAKIILIKDGEPTINYNYPICADCTQIHSLDMTRAGKCRPNALKDQEAQELKDCTA
jgi:hypothetical protein